MSEALLDPVGPLDPARPEPASEGFVIRAEFVLDGHRLVGDIRCPGVPRRLVDLLNSIDDPFFVLWDGELEEVGTPAGPDGRTLVNEIPVGAGPAASKRHFDAAHVHRSAVLFAVPITAPPPWDSGETVARKAIAARLVVPGYEISGSVYFPPETDPRTARFFVDHGFIPVTDAEIVGPGDSASARREELVVLNLSRVLLYALNDGLAPISRTLADAHPSGLARRPSASSTPGSRPQRSIPPKRTRRNSSA